MTEEERRERATSISTQRILTQHDFEQLKILEMKKRIQDRRRKRAQSSEAGRFICCKCRKA